MPKSAPEEVASERLLLRVLQPDQAERVVDYYRRNRDHHAPWSPPWPESFFAVDYWRRRLESARAELATDASWRVFLCEREDPEGPLRGHVNFTRFIRGPFQACLLGYGLDEAVVGRGYMTEALERALEVAFGPLGLHRVEANYVPTNLRSGAVLRRLGFEIQGYARDYLYIGDAWQDHVLTAKTSPNPATPEFL